MRCANPEANVPRGVGGMTTGRAGLRRNPSHNAPKGLGPPASTSLQDKWAECGPTFGNARGRVLGGPFTLLNLVKNIGHRGGGRGEVGAKSPRPPEPSRGTQTSAGRRPAAGGAGERREGSASEEVPPGSGGLGGRRRPGFSTSGETDVCSATAEQTTRSRLAALIAECEVTVPPRTLPEEQPEHLTTYRMPPCLRLVVSMGPLP